MDAFKDYISIINQQHDEFGRTLTSTDPKASLESKTENRVKKFDKKEATASERKINKLIFGQL